MAPFKNTTGKALLATDPMARINVGDVRFYKPWICQNFTCLYVATLGLFMLNFQFCVSSGFTQLQYLQWFRSGKHLNVILNSGLSVGTHVPNVEILSLTVVSCLAAISEAVTRLQRLICCLDQWPFHLAAISVATTITPAPPDIEVS